MPVKLVTVLSNASLAVTVILKAELAVAALGAEIEKWSIGPRLTVKLAV